MSRFHAAARWGGQRVTRARALWAQRIAHAAARGQHLVCSLCAQPIKLGQPWDLGHRLALSDGGDSNDYEPQHRACNRREGQALAQRAKRVTRTRRWL